VNGVRFDIDGHVRPPIDVAIRTVGTTREGDDSP